MSEIDSKVNHDFTTVIPRLHPTVRVIHQVPSSPEQHRRDTPCPSSLCPPQEGLSTGFLLAPSLIPSPPSRYGQIVAGSLPTSPFDSLGERMALIGCSASASRRSTLALVPLTCTPPVSP